MEAIGPVVWVVAVAASAVLTSRKNRSGWWTALVLFVPLAVVVVALLPDRPATT